MSDKPKLVNVTMVRPHLDHIAEHKPPRPYTIRPYKDGDDREFDRIWIAADTFGQAQPDLFEKEFGANREAVAERMFFICNGDRSPVGTATAWFNDDFQGERCGLVHWVAILPEHQGKGLSKPLMSVVLRRLAQLGHKRACLITQSARLVAIRLYLGFGFAPFMKTAEDAETWREIRANLEARSG